MSEMSSRYEMPLLHVGQANKEISHNEALTIIDGLIQPCVEGVLEAEPSNLSSQDRGRCWLVAPSASGGWAGQDNKIAYWTGEAWRFLTILESGKIFSKDIGAALVRGPDGWNSPTPITLPTGGTVIDEESRTAILAILSALEFRGIIPG